jgi:hypothetical protein
MARFASVALILAILAAPFALIWILGALEDRKAAARLAQDLEAHDAARMAECGIDWKRTAEEVTYDDRRAEP